MTEGKQISVQDADEVRARIAQLKALIDKLPPASRLSRVQGPKEPSVMAAMLNFEMRTLEFSDWLDGFREDLDELVKDVHDTIDDLVATDVQIAAALKLKAGELPGQP